MSDAGGVYVAHHTAASREAVVWEPPTAVEAQDQGLAFAESLHAVGDELNALCDGPNGSQTASRFPAVIADPMFPVDIVINTRSDVPQDRGVRIIVMPGPAQRAPVNVSIRNPPYRTGVRVRAVHRDALPNPRDPHVGPMVGKACARARGDGDG